MPLRTGSGTRPSSLLAWLSQRRRVVIVVVLSGMVLGVLWATLRSPVDPAPIPDNGTDSAAFGELFSVFFLGVPGPDTRYPYPSDTPLVERRSFVQNGRVGVRVQTAPGAPNRIPIEIRLVRSDTKEETRNLASRREHFTIQPGLQTYCCITMPNEVMRIDVRIIHGGRIIGDIQNIRVTRPLQVQ